MYCVRKILDTAKELHSNREMSGNFLSMSVATLPAESRVGIPVCAKIHLALIFRNVHSYVHI